MKETSTKVGATDSNVASKSVNASANDASAENGKLDSFSKRFNIAMEAVDAVQRDILDSDCWYHQVILELKRLQKEVEEGSEHYFSDSISKILQEHIDDLTLQYEVEVEMTEEKVERIKDIWNPIRAAE